MIVLHHGKLSDKSCVLLLLYIDDMLIAFKNIFEINNLNAQFSAKFEMKYLSIVKKILWMEIHRDLKASKLFLP